MNYQILTDATADLSSELMDGLPFVDVIPMEVAIENDSYTFGPHGNLSIDHFYAEQRSGKFASTSQINPSTYTRFFEKYLSAGQDVLYLGFTSGMSGSFQNSMVSAAELKDKYPERKLICLDTLCASVGEGFLIREAALQQAAGLSLDELADWVKKRRLQVCHWFTVDTFDHLRHGGRVGAAAAVLGTALQIKPMLHVTTEGTLEVAEKPRGAKRAMEAQLSRMRKGWQPELGRLVMIGHGDCPDRAETLAESIRSEFPEAEIFTVPIGPVIGSHTGPGMLAVLFWGNER